ncbi:NACHT domain-containing NTPase [Azonexus sp. R2A61]|uniref:NACHT domain-containing protein n=1 Tax=Azonexus sp. R2A61 TaxID=2744443 RepID=UPI001F435195|nr:NACHT domain-containing protein [Azonexus sp. R2A61]
MDSYQEIVLRLGQYLEDIEADRAKPLVDAANKYRLAAEAICKAIILGHGRQPQGLLEKLIADALKHVEADETARDAGMFKTEIRYLQNVGNTYSHDGSGSDLSNKQCQSAAFDSLTKVIWIAFFGNGNLDAPRIPRSMENQIPTRTLGRVKFENPRAEEVVRLCFPKHRVETKLKRSDHDNRLVYDYVTADLGGGLSKGMIFLRSRTALEKSLHDFLEIFRNYFPDSLEIITPRAYRPDGGEIDRRKSIVDVVRDLSLDSRGRKVHVKYFDDFVWDSCLPEVFRAGDFSAEKTSNFIEQTLFSLDDSGEPVGDYLSTSEYVSNILKSSNSFNPVHVVTGPAGIGKTTFCDDISLYINSQDRKRVILLSATDFREISISTSIDSVSDLYKVAVANGLLDDANSIESHNFEINLACGNFVLLIDGFDELESHLGTSLNFEKFMRSLVDLEECFRKVLVILTVRNYNLERFQHVRQASICRLRGFSSQDTDRYLAGRLPKETIPEAKRLLQAFNENGESERLTTIPLYASLICDYLIDDEESVSSQPLVVKSDSARFFTSGKPLDTLVKKIVDREITKQSLGNIGPDDFFDILIEIIRAPQCTVTKESLLSYISACDSDEPTVNPVNFLRNPFLLWDGETITFKYDSLSYFFKSRLLARKIIDGQFSEQPAIEFMAEFCRGDGPLYDEIVAVLPPATYAYRPNTIKWFRSLVQYAKRDAGSTLPWRKAISAFMYWAVSRNIDKAERSETINVYFESKIWPGFSIFGEFFPVNLSGITVQDGHIENYTNLQNCEYVNGVAVFYNTQVNFDDRSLPDKLDRSLFGAGCKFSSNLSASFQTKKVADESWYEVIRDNLYKIIKVGFRANHFSWKSGSVYKTVTVVGKLSLNAYLEFLSEKGVLDIEISRADSEPGYVVSKNWSDDARKLVEEKNVTKRMAALIADLIRSA